MNALGGAAKVTLRSTARVGHLLWLEVTGLFFIAFAVIGGVAAWENYSRHKVLSGRLVAALFFMVIFAWFGVSSFYRARQRASPEGASHVPKDEDRNSYPR